MTQEPAHQYQNKKLLYIIAFTMAFCSICYELLIATKLSRMMGEGIFIYPGFIGIFMFFMGLGSLVWYRKSEEIGPRSIQVLWLIEMILTALGFFSLVFIDLCYGATYPNVIVPVLLGVVWGALIGFLTGQELPLLFHFCGYLRLDQKEIRRMIFFDYLASFCSSLMLTLFFFPLMGLFKATVIISFLNLLAAALILMVFSQAAIRIPRWAQTLFAIVFGLYVGTFGNLDKFENQLIKLSVVGRSNSLLVNKFNTLYQQVLVFVMRKDFQPVDATPQEILLKPEEYYLYVTLNGAMQFFDDLSAGADAYHTYLIDSFVRLMPNVKNILILGGIKSS